MFHEATDKKETTGLVANNTECSRRKTGNSIECLRKTIVNNKECLRKTIANRTKCLRTAMIRAHIQDLL